MTSINFLTKALKIASLLPFFHHRSSFVNVPTLISVTLLFWYKCQGKLKRLYFSHLERCPQLFWREQSSNKQRKLEVTSCLIKRRISEGIMAKEKQTSD